MMGIRLNKCRLIFLGILFISNFVGADSEISDPAAPYIREGGIGFEPNEECQYRPWIVYEKVRVYERPDLNSKVIFTVSPKDELDPLKEEVHVIPGIAILRKNIEGNYLGTSKVLSSGSTIYLRQYIGEGSYNVLCNGEPYQMGINMYVYDTPGVCKSSDTNKNCWLSVTREPKEVWWAYIHSKMKNKNGWISPNTEDMDLCNPKLKQNIHREQVIK